MKKAPLFGLIGTALGLGAPLGAFLLRILESSLPLEDFTWMEWTNHSFFYIYTLVGSCLVFGLFGYFTGRSEDKVLKRNVVLKNQSMTDPLTGLGNHRFLHDVLKIEFRRHLSRREPISCLMMDLDRFKRINDRWGHPFGDTVLKRFAGIVRRTIRQGDTATRYGGEEFLCILPNCNEREALWVAERIRKGLQAHVFRKDNRNIRVTVSVGAITSYESDILHYRHLINLADHALYEAKHKGRNQVIQAVLKPSTLVTPPSRSPKPTGGTQGSGKTP